MCSGSKSEANPCKMDALCHHQDKQVIVSHDEPTSNLLELAATDDLKAFRRQVEELGCDADEASLWYGRSFGSKKMGYEQRTPIAIASLYGSTEVLHYLVRTKMVDVNRACGSDRATPLHCAAAGGSWSCLEVVRILLEASAEVNAVDVAGKKPVDLIAPSVKPSTSLKRKTLETMLSGARYEDLYSHHLKQDYAEEEAIRTPKSAKDYQPAIDVPLPDINVGVYMTDEFRMYTFKVKPCSRAYSHDWTECPFVHPGENARRRDPRKYSYTCVPCPEFKKGSCNRGDSCDFAHGVFESWLHPAQYRTRLCKDETGCTRKVCFFAHKPEELRPVYASTGSGLPSPKSTSGVSLDTSGLSPLKLGSPSLMMMMTSTTPPMSPTVAAASSPPTWQNKSGHRSRLQATLSARDMELDVLNLEKIRTQMADEMANLSSPYASLSQLQLQSPTGIQLMQNMNQLRASYPSNHSSSPARKPSAVGFDSSAAVAQAVMNSHSSAFARRSQSFVERSAVGGGHRSTTPLGSSKFGEWGLPEGRVDWGFNGHEDASKLRRSSSFGLRSGELTKLPSSAMAAANEPDVSWVDSLVRNSTFGDGGDWVDQMYAEEHVFA